MARSRAQRRTAAAPPSGPRLFDLPAALLESILLLLSLKARVRFATTCRAARQLVDDSWVLLLAIFSTCRSRTQSLALLRWLSAGCRNALWLNLSLTVQQVPIVRQLGQGIGMQGACLQILDLRVHDGPLVLEGSWLSSLVRQRSLKVQATAVELGSGCGQLATLQHLNVSCGYEVPTDYPILFGYYLLRPCTVAVQPGAIPPSLTNATFLCCAMPELPAALSAATGLRQLRLERCAVRFGSAGPAAAPLMGPVLSSLTALEKLELLRMRLTDDHSVPAQLAGLTHLQHLDLSDSLLCEGGEQALCSTFPHLSSLTFLSLAAGSTAGNLTAAPGALPALRELRLLLPSDCEDQRLPVLAAAPHLQHLMVCGSTLLCDSNVEALRTLPQLCSLAVQLPHTEEMWDAIDASGALRLIDAIASLPALSYVLLMFQDKETEEDEHFGTILPGLQQRNISVASMLSSDSMYLLLHWPVLYRPRY